MPAPYMQPSAALEIAFAFDPGLVQIAYQQEVLKDLPLAYYRLRETALPFVDLSLYGVANPTTANPTLAAAASPITGEGGSEPTFNGTTQQILWSTTWFGGPPSATWTMEAWYLTSSAAANQTIMYHPSGAALGGPLLRVDAGKLTAWVVDSGGTFHSVPELGTSNDGLWHHAVATWDGVTLRLYKDGVVNNTIAYGAIGQPSAAGANSYVGSISGSQWFVGDLGEAALYPRALSAARIAAHYAARVRGNPAADLASLPWCNVSPYGRQIGTQRGRQHELNRVETGTATAMAVNHDRRFEPEYAGAIFNLVTNPSFEVDASAWATDGGSVANTIAVDATDAAYGGQSGKITATAGGALLYRTFQYAAAFLAGDAYSFSVWVKGIGGTVGKTAFVQIAGLGGAHATATLAASAPVALTAAWQRLKITANVDFADRTSIVASVQMNTPANGDAFRIDGAQLQIGVVTDYVDGDADNARWAGTRQLSATYLGGPYYPNVVPMRRFRLRAAFPPQLVPNGSFERSAASPAPWTTFLGGAATFNANAGADALPNTGLARCISFTSPAGAGTDQGGATSDYIPVDATKIYSLSAYFNKSGAGNPYTALRVLCYDDEKNLLGYAAPAGLGGDGNFAMAGTGVWEKHGGSLGGTANVSGQAAFLRGTKYVQVVVYGFFNPSRAYTGTVSIDDVALTPGATTFADAAYSRLGDYDANDAWKEVWNGYIENFGIEWQPNARKGTVTITCVDALEALAVANISVPIPVQLSGTRVKFAADAAGYPRSERAIMPGLSLVQAGDFLNSPATPGAHISDVADTEGGIDFIGKDGKLVFQDRSDRITGGAHAVSVATFGDGPPSSGELPYTDLTPNYGIDQVYNRVIVTRAGGLPQTAEDATSQQQYWIRELDKSTLHTTDGDALAVAGVLLSRYKQPLFRFDAIKTEGKRSPLLWPAVLSREISDRITVVRRPGVSAPVGLVRAVHIESVAHTLDLQNSLSWETEFQLSPADTQNYWVMDTSALDTGTRLSL